MTFRGSATPMRSGRRFFFYFFALTLIVGFTATTSTAQTATAGTVTGQVTDESNAVVPGAEVKAVENSTKITQTATTNDAGRYIFSQVPPGIYNIVITKQGFSTYEVNG